MHVFVKARGEPQVSYLKNLGFWARSLTGTWGLWTMLNWLASESWVSVYIRHPSLEIASLHHRAWLFMKPCSRTQPLYLPRHLPSFCLLFIRSGTTDPGKRCHPQSGRTFLWIKPLWKHPQDIHRGLFPLGILNRHTDTEINQQAAWVKAGGWQFSIYSALLFFCTYSSG